MYEYRRAGKNWRRVLDDYGSVALCCLKTSAAGAGVGVRDEARPLLDHLLHLWVQFKRDVDAKSPAERRILVR